jgi:hypothetical protein
MQTASPGAKAEASGQQADSKTVTQFGKLYSSLPKASKLRKKTYF